MKLEKVCHFYLVKTEENSDGPLELAPKEKVLKLDSEYLNNIVNILDLTELHTLNGKFYTTVNLHVLDNSFKSGGVKLLRHKV